jgi:hypothetical protein
MEKRRTQTVPPLQLAENYFSWITLKSTAGNWFTTSSNVNKPPAVSSTSPEGKVFNSQNCCTAAPNSQTVQLSQTFKHYIIIISIIIIIIPLMQGTHTYIPETNHISRVYRVAVILHVLLMVHIALSAILNSFVLLH